MKAQISVESVMLVGISTLLLIPVTYLFYTFLETSSVEIIENSVHRIGNSFIQNANRMYYLGNRAKIVVDYSFPEEIRNMTVERNRLLAFQVETPDGIEWMTYDFGHNVSTNFTAIDFTEGDKTFEFKTIRGGDVVSIKRI